jgi:hypothetical protein
MKNFEAPSLCTTTFVKDLKVGDVITHALTPAQWGQRNWPASFSTVTRVHTTDNRTTVETDNGSHFSRVNLATVLVK